MSKAIKAKKKQDFSQNALRVVELSTGTTLAPEEAMLKEEPEPYIKSKAKKKSSKK